MTSKRYRRTPGETVSSTVIEAMADLTGYAPLDLVPLGSVVDVEVLDRLATTSTDRPADVTVTFEYCDHRVTVTPTEVRIDR